MEKITLKTGNQVVKEIKVSSYPIKSLINSADKLLAMKLIDNGEHDVLKKIWTSAITNYIKKH